MAVTANFLAGVVAVAHTPQPIGDAADRRPGVFARFFRAMHEARARQVEAEIAARAGLNDLLTDDIERKMGEAMFRSGRPLI